MRNAFLLSVIFVLIAVGLYSQVISPWLDSAFAKYEHIEELRSVFAQGQDLQVRSDALRSEKNTISEAQQALIKNAIPEHSPGNVILFLLALDTLIKERSGLPLDTKYTIGTEREGDDGVVLLPISFSFGEVSYDILRRFITSLQRWERGVRIQSMQIGLPADEDLADQGLVRATIAIEALFSAKPDTL